MNTATSPTPSPHADGKPRDPDARALRDTFNGKVVWRKYAVADKIPFTVRLQTLLAPLLRMDIARVSYIADRRAALAFEAARLERLCDKGFRVPSVLQRQDDMLMLSDIGTTLDVTLADAPAEARATLLREAARALGVLHAYGEFHGRPKLKDIAHRGSSIGFIDMDEDALRVMTLPEAQARDVLIFMQDAARFAPPGEEAFAKLMDTYLNAAPQAARVALDDALKGMRRIERATGPLLRVFAPGLKRLGDAMLDAVAARPRPAARGEARTTARPV